MTKIQFRPELWELGRAFKKAREELGYTQTTMGRALGYMGNNAKKNIRHFEGARRPIPKATLATLHKFITEGLPPDAPKPDLSDAREKYERLWALEKKDKRAAPAALKPGAILIRKKKELLK